MRGNLVFASWGWVAAIGTSGFLAAVADADLYVQGVGDDHVLAELHNRFYTGADRDFIADHLDLTGIGRAQNGAWATLISDQYFLTAAHFHPKAGQTITFTNDQTSPNTSYSYVVDDWQKLTTYDGRPSDVMIGRLTEPVREDDGLATYHLMTGDEASLTGLEVYMYGKSHRVGTNEIEHFSNHFYYDSHDNSFKTRALWLDFDATGGTGISEAYLKTGDSGAPVFVEVNGEVRLVGLNLANSTGSLDPWNGASSIASSLSFYSDQILASIPPAVTTPEPASLMLLASGAGLMLLRRRI